MILINQVTVKPGYTEEELKKKVSSILKVFSEDIMSLKIHKISVDARKKPEIFLSLSVLCEVTNEENVIRKNKNNNDVSIYDPVIYRFKVTGNEIPGKRPIIVGAGPAGLFCAYYLSLYGYKPIIIERGFDIESRTKTVEEFWKTGVLNVNSNVQFGEGGAGAFSDGKLNTLVKDKEGRNREVLNVFVQNGANPDILTSSKPHIGTDVLVNVVKSMRECIKKWGGEIRYNAELTDIFMHEDSLVGIEINGSIKLDTNILILAIGHSARNTFEMLYKNNVMMHQKDFAVGLRVEHNQRKIDKALYGEDEEITKYLGPSSYKLTYQSSCGRGVYSFCMCPGGYVVNASSEEGRLCTNGMSYRDRSGKNANSAIIVTVNKNDFGDDHPLSGIKFQRALEEKAYELGNGRIPVQYYKDFKQKVQRNVLDEFNVSVMDFDNLPEMKGDYCFCDLSELMKPEMNKAFVEAMDNFAKKIDGFNDDYTILSGIESRTSSPVRLDRDDNFESVSIKGIYPCGEGAGYAGGIMSAAMDGMKVAEAVARRYRPFERNKA